MKVLVYSIHGFDKPFLEHAAGDKHELIFTEVSLNAETAYLAKGCDAVALFTSDHASSDVVETLHSNNIRFIALRSVGYEHIDILKAQSLRIKVANVPSYSQYAIAEYTVALLLSLVRKMNETQQLMNNNNFLLDTLVGFDLHGKTIGIVGTGKIGSAFVKIMNGFGCKLIGCDINENLQLIKDTGI